MGGINRAIQAWRTASKDRKFWVALSLIAVFGFVWGRQNLLDSPRPWFDEGIYLQVAKNVAQEGLWALRVSPHQTVGLEYITVGFPVILPVAFSIRIFGASLLAARSVMLAWIVLGILLAGYLGYRMYGRKAGLASASFLASFGPWYANGKNVMGEVPGLVLMMASLIFLTRIEKGERHWWDFFWLTTFACLAAVSKPSFLVLGPAMVLAIAVLLWRGVRLTWPIAAAIIVPIVSVFAVWMWTQFGGFPGSEVLHHYLNPYGLDDVGAVMRDNFLGMLTHVTPLHLLLMSGLIVIAFYLRGWRKIKAVECALSFVIVLTLFSYLRTAGWYRYFFVAQISCFLLLPLVPMVFSGKLHHAKQAWLMPVFVIFFIAMNLVALIRDPAPMYGQGWRKIEDWLKSDKASGSLMFVNVPEAVYFFRGKEYSQFLRITDKLSLGDLRGGTDMIVAPNPLPDKLILPYDYHQSEQLGSYAIWRKD